MVLEYFRLRASLLLGTMYFCPYRTAAATSAEGARSIGILGAAFGTLALSPHQPPFQLCPGFGIHGPATLWAKIVFVPILSIFAIASTL